MIQTEQRNDTMVVKPAGQITADNADVFRQQLQELVDAGHVNLVIDLADVDMIDSKGLAVFIVCYKSLGTKNGNLVVTTDNADFKNLFHVMRMDEHFTVRGSDEDA